LFAAIAFFPERYGENLIHLALDILNKKTTPPAVYMPVQVLTPRNVNDCYPHDTFTAAADLVDRLF
jgi:ribose transport system substrate-binding protein